MNSILRDNVTCATGLCTGSAAAISGYDVAGKTGTVEEHQDAWFCGYSTNLTTCVWMGFPQGDSDAYSMVPSVGSDASFGGGYPTEIWQKFMSSAFADYPKVYPPTTFPDVQAPADYYQPFTSQFPLYVAPIVTPTKPDKSKSGNGSGNGTTGGGTTSGGGGTTSGGGGGTTSGGGGGGTTSGGGGGGTTNPPTT